MKSKTREELKKKNEGRLRDLLDNVKETNIHVIGVPDKKRKKRG